MLLREIRVEARPHWKLSWDFSEIITFLSTLAFLSPALNLLLIPIALYRIFYVRRIRISAVLGLNQRLGAILMILALGISGIVYLLVPSSISNFDKSIIGGFPYIWLVFLSLPVGLAFNRDDLRAIVILVFIEIAIGVVEYSLGIHSVLSVKFLGETQIGDTDLLYYNRVFGLSSNSSTYAFKVMSAFAIILALKNKLPIKLLVVCGLILVAGFVTSFNRTAIISAAVGLTLVYARSVKSAIAITFFGLIVALSFNLERMFTRGEGHVDLSGRDMIFSEFYQFINDHPFFGNGCEKVWMVISGNLYHAHNSYLELVASNGIIIAAIFFLGYYLFIMSGRIRIASIFLIFSTFQYGILWGLTFNDIIFAGLLSYLLMDRLADRAENNISSDNRLAALLECNKSY